MTDRELMQQALNVLKIFVDGGNSAWARKIIEIKEALRDRLAQPEQEPVAWITTWNEHGDAGVELHWAKQDKGLSSKHTPLYYSPQREWVGLTDEEMMMIYGQSHEGKKYSLGRAIEAKLKEKNT